LQKRDISKNLKTIILVLAIAALTFSGIASAQAPDKPVPVTVKNFQRAESDLYYGQIGKGRSG
jgi:hypothetical protein